MHSIDVIRQNKLKETEQNLQQMGLVKCLVCGSWMDKDFKLDHINEEHKGE